MGENLTEVGSGMRHGSGSPSAQADPIPLALAFQDQDLVFAMRVPFSWASPLDRVGMWEHLRR
jgi:hypothetical protein